MTKYKIQYKIANRYGEPYALWTTKTGVFALNGYPLYEKPAILRELGLTPNHGIEILKIISLLYTKN